jgi:ubiquinone/menaquinone biosynthesis C-methylase UbiE
VNHAAQGPAPSAADLDAINRGTWRLPSPVRLYEKLEGWTDPGEQAAVEHVAARVRSRPILDIGVGAGRTTTLLKKISSDYVGIDYTREMVDACRAKHPGTRIEHMDARDLGAFEDDSFALVMFSYNGIDAVDYADRQQVLREVHRVLQPGGLFIVSAHNRDGPGAREQKPRPRLQFTWNPLRLAWRVLKLGRSWVQALRNHRRYSVLNEEHDGWSVMNCAAHDFGIVIVYTTLAEQKRQLQAAGFTREIVLDSTCGRPVADGTDTHDIAWFHHVVRKA